MRWAFIRSSRRLIEVEVYGSVFLVISRRSCHGWYRRHDNRFKLMPRWWHP